MKIYHFLIAITVASSSIYGRVDPDIVYGDDNRLDFFEVGDSKKQEQMRSTAGMVYNLQIQKKDDGSFQVQSPGSIKDVYNLCKDEKFINQPVLTFCSGFLVSPDKIVTAGHCFKLFDEDMCKEASWVFGLNIKNSEDLGIRVSADDIYKCKKVIVAEMNEDNLRDFAVIQLDRKVVDRDPLDIRTSGIVDITEPLYVIGTPSGLPQKLATGSTVRKNSNPYYFEANLDTFGGNSGSAVFNIKTDEVEGILVRGRQDYVLSDPSDESSCLKVNTCDQNGLNCRNKSGNSDEFEHVSRISEILKYL
ncbi:MAG: trypsin-like peptidase domain-containing protein [Bacteriovoracaceae bacterium]|jgi:hypothetical protein|nr:trypsin-like peptidase domain-containing protein [Bacteriovoracaceae bacterium]